jgi:hypothetical protein
MSCEYDNALMHAQKAERLQGAIVQASAFTVEMPLPFLLAGLCSVARSPRSHSLVIKFWAI